MAPKALMRYFLTRGMFKKHYQKKHLNEKICIINQKLWDTEFLLTQMRAEREDIRMSYDRTRENLGQVKEKLKTEQDKKVITGLKKLVDKAEPDIENMMQQMKGIDEQTEGREGINNTISGYRNVIKMLKDYKKDL